MLAPIHKCALSGRNERKVTDLFFSLNQYHFYGKNIHFELVTSEIVQHPHACFIDFVDDGSRTHIFASGGSEWYILD